MPNPPMVACTRCAARIPAGERNCPACLLRSGQSMESAADELFQLACRLSRKDQEALVAEAEHGAPRLAATVRARLNALRASSESPTVHGGVLREVEGPGLGQALEEAPGSWVDAFELVRCLGEGGMGTVWEAVQHTPVRRTVALKLIRLGMQSREVIRRFERERQTLALLNHPGIAQVFEAGITTSGRPYFVMEMVAGSPITEACAEARLSLRSRLELFLQVCAAVEHAHQKGVIHRDLKPSNVLAGGGRVKIIDFGIAKATEEAGDSMVTRRAQILGTPAYMSPEQALSAGAGLDTRTDVYSLGGILYELLAGVPPFDPARLARVSIAEMQSILLNEEPAPPGTRVVGRTGAGSMPGIPDPSELRGDLDRVVMKALRKDREQRYSSPAALAEDLRRYLAGEPVMAVPLTLGYQMGKFARRHRPAVVGALLTMSALIAGLVISVRQAAVARRAERSAMRALTDMSTRSGLAADAAGDVSRAALWFAHAAVVADEDPGRQDSNRRRAAAWRAGLSTPVRALETGFEHLGELLWNSRHPALIVSSEPFGRSVIWDLPSDQIWKPPGTNEISRALWDPTGDRIALADGATIRVLEFPSGRELAVLRRGGPNCWAFHPHEPWLVIGANPPELWNWRSGERRPFLGPDRVPSSVEFSRDGTRLLLAWGSEAGVVRTATPRVFLHDPVPHAASGKALFLGTGDRYVTAGADGSISVHETERGVVLDRYPATGPGSGYPIVASPDGRVLVRRAAPALDLEARAQLPFPVHRNVFISAAFTSHGSLLATGGYDDVLNLWDVNSGLKLQTVGHHQHAVEHIAISPDGQIASGQDGLVRVWKLPEASPLVVIQAEADSLVRLSPDGRFLVPSGMTRRSGRLRRTQLWEVASGRPAGSELDPGGVILDAGFTSDGQKMVLAVSTTADRVTHPFRSHGGSGALQWWNPGTGRRLMNPVELPSEPRGLAMDPSGDWVAVLCGDGQLLEYSCRSNSLAVRGRFRDPFPPEGTLQNGSCAYSPDGRWLAAWGVASGLLVWDRETQRLCIDEASDPSTVFDVDFHGNRVLVARMSQASRLECLQLPSGLPASPFIPYPNWPFLARFDADGTRILVTGRDRAGHLWEWQTGRRLGPALAHDGEVMAGAFVPGRSWVVTGAHDGRVRFWDSPSGLMMGPALELPGSVLKLQFTPDGRTLIACGGMRGQIFLIDMTRLLPEPSMDVEGAFLLAALDAAAAVSTEDGLSPLSAEEWIVRWRAFRSRYPGFPGHRIEPAAAR